MNIPGIYTSYINQWKNFQTVWIYSDPHFGESELETGLKNKPTDDEQIKLINSKVGKKDVLILLGDCGDPLCCAKLRGYKILIMGNHDAGRSNYENCFNEIYEGSLFLGEKLLLSHEPINFPFAFNIHGHVHSGFVNKKGELNVCSAVINYTPVNLNLLMKRGLTSKISSLHRQTINHATWNKEIMEAMKYEA